jgi:hypothetical protein
MINGSKNKGDWGEFYALIYLLATRELHVADENLNRVSGFYFPIIKVIRDERINNVVNHMDYIVSTDMDGINTVEIYMNSKLMKTMTAQEFKDEADRLLIDIPAGKESQFSIPHGEKFLNDIYLERLAAPSTDVTDIKMELHDTNTGTNQEMGFSIKSYLGSDPSLLNASVATNFVYEVVGVTNEQMLEINAIDTKSKIIDRIRRINDVGGSLVYVKTANDVFSSNLMMIDSRMENIIAEMLLYYYQGNDGNCCSVIEYIEQKNPLNYPRKGLYTYKFKKFLCAKALGMDPSKEWYGIDEANGGYIAVKSDGDVLAYHLYNRNKFEQYLLDNTHFERGSTSRHQYATIYEKNNKMYINLNLQIRFYGNH